MSNSKNNSLRYVREIGAYRLMWEEASKRNGNMPWLIIKAASGSWQLKLRGDNNITLMWRRLLETDGTEDYLHGQLRMMQLMNTTINDPITEVFVQSLVLANVHLLGKDDKTISDFNTKRMEIAQELVKLVNGLIPQERKESPVTDEEKGILNEMRTAEVNKELQDVAEKEGNS